MGRKGYLIGRCAAFGMLLLIIDSKTAIVGAAKGIELCLKTVIPSLFPFFVLSSMLTSSLLGLGSKFLAPIGRLCGIPSGAESIFFTGLIGGYPLGARNIAQARLAGQLSKADAERMLAFCSNAGPAFIFGMAGSMFDQAWIPWVLWGIHILGAIVTAVILPRNGYDQASVRKAKLVSLPEALRSSLIAMANVCGWVVLFRVVIAFLERWILWIMPQVLQACLSGLLELANGCCALDRIPNTGLRFIICSAILAFGGLCVAMQTISVSEGVSIKLYLPGKLLQTSFCVIIACIVQYLSHSIETSDSTLEILLISFAVFVVTAGILRKLQKSSSIPVPIGV